MPINVYSVQSDEFADIVSDYILEEANKRILSADIFKFVLSGGNTPVSIFEKLVTKQSEVDWKKIQLFWLDERCVPIDSNDSNYGNCKRYLIDRLRVEPEAYPMYSSGSPLKNAEKYQHLLDQKFRHPDHTMFDLVLLGIGTDGHVASLFPGTKEMDETDRLVVPTQSPFKPSKRISLTFPAMNSTRKSLIIAKGSEKKWVLDACMEGKPDLSIPACNINPKNGDLIWYVSF